MTVNSRIIDNLNKMLCFGFNKLFVTIQILKLYTSLVVEKVLFSSIIYDVLEEKSVYSNVPIMKLKCITVIIMRMLELVVVIALYCDTIVQLDSFGIF